MSLPIHPACQFVCQKEQHIGERCANDCELAPFANIAIPEPDPAFDSCFDADTGQCEFCDQLPGVCHCVVVSRGAPVIVANTPTGTLCSICGEPQVSSPSGVTCKFGHGGAPAKELIEHQAAQVKWGQEHGYYPPAPPPPLPVVKTIPGFGNTTIQLPPPPVLASDLATSPIKQRINVRAKGQRGERQVVQLLQAVVDKIRAKYHAEPLTLQRNALQAHLGGADLHGLQGFAVEVKHVEVEAVSQWWKQTVRQAEQLATHGTPHVPVLFYRASHKPWRVKFRAYVQTPRDRDLIELDIETELADFLEWFENAYDEIMSEWVQTLS